MKVRYFTPIAVSVIALLFFASCGGSSLGVMSVVPRGDFFRLDGSNPAAKFQSSFYLNLADEIKSYDDALKSMEDKMEDMGIELNQAKLDLNLSSTESGESFEFFSGPFNEADLEDYFKDERGWEKINEEDYKGQRYFSIKREGSNGAYMLTNGGVLIGSDNIIEDIIKVRTAGKRKLQDHRAYSEAQNLVDFNASEFMLQWDNMDSTVQSFKALIRQVDDDEDLMDAIDDLRAIGISSYWGNDFRIVIKMKFKRERNAETLRDMFDDDMDKIFKNFDQTMIRSMFGSKAETKDFRDLSEMVKINLNGNVLQLSMTLKWEDIEDLIG